MKHVKLKGILATLTDLNIPLEEKTFDFDLHTERGGEY